jgi:hypothetical protein
LKLDEEDKPGPGVDEDEGPPLEFWERFGVREGEGDAEAALEDVAPTFTPSIPPAAATGVDGWRGGTDEVG